jgi:hypothetical protein
MCQENSKSICTSFDFIGSILARKKIKLNLAFSSLIRTFAGEFKGCSLLWAEMIPSKPDSDNADVGMNRVALPPYFKVLINKVKRK